MQEMENKPIIQVFQATHPEVSQSTDGLQNPWENNGLQKEFCFAECKPDIIIESGGLFGKNTGRKAVIGAGIVAGLGGGLWWALSQEKENIIPYTGEEYLFTGIFKSETRTWWGDIDDPEAEGITIEVFELNQNGGSVTGIYQATGTNYSCCTAAITANVNGTVIGDGDVASFDISEEANSCTGTNAWGNSCRASASSTFMSGDCIIRERSTLVCGNDSFVRQ